MKNQDLVKKIIESKAVDFTAIGKVVSELGPSLALLDEPWEGFCGTMRHYVRFYVLSSFPGENGVSQENA